ncbi:MAG TPA: hypothetical protein VGC42_01625, partial [Kofleriaceae bacterium]
MHHGGSEADPRRRDACFGCGTLHFEADQVVDERDAPQLLTHALRGPAADRLVALQQVRLDLVVRDLQLPALVV